MYIVAGNMSLVSRCFFTRVIDILTSLICRSRKSAGILESANLALTNCFSIYLHSSMTYSHEWLVSRFASSSYVRVPVQCLVKKSTPQIGLHGGHTRILPSAETRHAPMGTPPSEAPLRASSSAAWKPISLSILVVDGCYMRVRRRGEVVKTTECHSRFSRGEKHSLFNS